MIIAGIAVEVQRKNIKHLHLYVKPPSSRAQRTEVTVAVSAPLFTSTKTIERFVQEKLPWIHKQIARVESQAQHERLEYVTGETLFVWGKPYQLLVTEGKRSALEIIGGTVVFTIRAKSTVEQKERLVREWYRGLLKAEAARLFSFWEEATGLRATSWQTKYMTSRWGTCNTKTGKVWLNVQLATKAPACLEYVTLHELVHLVERGHGVRFKALMDQYLPEWRKTRALLNGRI